MQFYRPCLFDPDKHRREDFSCGDQSMNDWLRRYVAQNRRGNTAATGVIADPEYRLAYATLSMTSIDRTASPKPLAKGAPAAVPALLIGRLATDWHAAGLGVGTPDGRAHPVPPRSC